MKKTEITLLGCGSSLGVPRIDGYWGKVDKKNKKNHRMRCSLFIKYKDIKYNNRHFSRYEKSTFK